MKQKAGLYVTEIYSFEQHTKLELPTFTIRIPAGFPSPGDDYLDDKLDLNEYLIKHPSATFFMRVEGDSMVNAGINSGDLLIVDRAMEATNGSIVVAIVDGEFTVKRFQVKDNKAYLVAENSHYHPIEITPEMRFEVWGVVTYVIHRAK
jgi:DNA polymerase V